MKIKTWATALRRRLLQLLGVQKNEHFPLAYLFNKSAFEIVFFF